MRLTKKTYLLGFIAVVVLLALVRCAFPAVAEPRHRPQEMVAEAAADSVRAEPVPEATDSSERRMPRQSMRHHRILSVPSFGTTFPDTNAVQLVAAKKWGVRPVANRADAETRKRELVYIGASPYYKVDPLHSSIPYLVPRAAVLLQDIGRAFFDSLAVKGVPLHKMIVTSVLRSQDDVVRLRRHNGNATENSCHLYGTTFDVCYNRYQTVEDPDGPRQRAVHSDTLKWILSEVLRDMRQKKRCYIKYEVKQGCFHMTVR